ncbi:MAG: small-conductance mechanosensitive channel [Rhodothermales bacterium]|jgi:small-conductance mechanosensitive channel
MLAILLPGCERFGIGTPAAETGSLAVEDSVSAAALSVGGPAGSTGARRDTLLGVLPLGVIRPPADDADPGPDAALAVLSPPSGSPVVASDSLAKVVAALVLNELRGQFRDTLIVRLDTPSVAGTDTTSSRPVERIQEGLRNVGARIVFALLVILGAFYILQGILWILEAIADRSANRRLFFKRLIPIVRMVMWAIVIYFIVTSVFEVDRNGLIAASAALGVGIGLAAQDLIKNLLGGIIIIFDAPFQVGDKVSVGNTYGEVKSIGLRSTRIVTLEDSLVSVPNSQVVDGQVANANAGVLDCQVVTTLWLPGWTDASLAKKIAYEAAANSRYVFLDKPIVVHIRDEFRETFLTKIVVKAYVLDHLYESALETDITETAKMGFLKAGLLYPVYGLETPDDILGRTGPGGDA